MCLQAFPVVTQAATDFVKVIPSNEPPASRPAVTPTQPVTTAAPSKPGPTLVKVRTILLPILNMLSPLYHLNAAGQCMCSPMTAKPAEDAV